MNRNTLKNTLFACTLLIGLSGLLASKQSVDKSLAKVDRIEGVLVFTNATPVSDYEYLGTVKSNTMGMGDSQYTGVLGRLIKNCKKDYPEADGIILSLVSGKKDKADAIKFK